MISPFSFIHSFTFVYVSTVGFVNDLSGDSLFRQTVAKTNTHRRGGNGLIGQVGSLVPAIRIEPKSQIILY